jgi:hypothetical protein
MIAARALLDELTALELRPAISILMETHRAGREIGQDWIRLKNLLRAVERQLDARGLARDDTARLLEAGQALVDERAFWRHQEDGLAVYAAPNFFRTYHCPQPLREMAVVSDRFHVTQLFPLLSADRRFYVLALSQKNVRLIEATRTSAVEVDLGDLPRSVTEALMTEPPGQELQHHVVSAVGAEHAAMFHGHGGGGLEHRKEEIRQFFHQLDRGLHPLLKDREDPLVLAAVEYLVPLYRETNTHPGLLPDGILGNSEGQSASVLGARAWDIVHAHLDRAETRAIARYQDLAGSGRVSTDLATVVRAAHEGRIADLFLAAGTERWGSFEPASGALTVRDGPGVVGEDLLNVAAIHAFQRGATIHVLERARVPEGHDVAALFRY